jgi:hypothetical protein
MHFGRTFYSILSGDILTVICPIDYRFCLACIVFSALLGWLLTIKYHRSPAPWIWLGLANLVIIGLISSSATVVLDAKQRKVDVTRVLFFYPVHKVYDLAGLQGAAVHDSDESDALRLVFSNGTDIQLTPYTQMGGKNQAAAAINAFVQQHGGQGVEY